MCLTEQELLEIEQRAERAAPGPWKTYRSDYSDLFYVYVQDHCVASLESVNNAEFIAHAREDVTRLVEEVRRLRKALAHVRDDINQTLEGGE